ncbi:MAG: nitroreductase family protein [Syntrophomonadaceae bacterium]|jgi:nitroreductase|nr:nitroreductase family protein [Bacillota bacterium]NLP25429.1 nitroreductase [Syntrophomonadaceae bacterium]
METRECIKTRRSIRRFTEQPIPDEVLNELLDAVRWAPSWANTQCWEVVVVKDPDTRQKLVEALAPNNPATKGVAGAPVNLVMCARRGTSGYKKGELTTNRGDWGMFDVGIAAQNLCLAAHDLGLGTVHVGLINHQAVDELLGLPSDVESLEIIPVGYPEKVGNAPPRKELSEFVHWDKYGNK